MNNWHRQREQDEDRAKALTVPKLLTRVAFFGTLAVLLIWGPWALAPRLLMCAGGVLVYMGVSYSTPLNRHM
jgi:hypothetical protein